MNRNISSSETEGVYLTGGLAGQVHARKKARCNCPHDNAGMQ